MNSINTWIKAVRDAVLMEEGPDKQLALQKLEHARRRADCTVQTRLGTDWFNMAVYYLSKS